MSRQDVAKNVQRDGEKGGGQQREAAEGCSAELSRDSGTAAQVAGPRMPGTKATGPLRGMVSPAGGGR